MIRNRIVFILSIIGIVIAIYVLQSFMRETPIVCVNTGCETVRKSPHSYIFSIPIPTFGLIGYFFLALLSFIRTVSNKHIYFMLMKYIAIFGILFVSWFTYTEIVIIQGVCMWCAVSAINMYTIAIVLLTKH